MAGLGRLGHIQIGKVINHVLRGTFKDNVFLVSPNFVPCSWTKTKEAGSRSESNLTSIRLFRDVLAFSSTFFVSPGAITLL